MGIETAFLVGASLLAGGGAVYGGLQQQQRANWQAAQSDADADAAKAAAKVEAERVRKVGRAQAGEANAALAASGIETGEGTALRITSAITGNAEQDAYMTLLNGVDAAARYRSQAQADRFRGRNAFAGGLLNGGSALLNGWVNRPRGARK